MGHQETCTKDMWTKPKGVVLRGGRGDGWGRGGVVGGKWKQLYFNNRNIRCKNILSTKIKIKSSLQGIWI